MAKAVATETEMNFISIKALEPKSRRGIQGIALSLQAAAFKICRAQDADFGVYAWLLVRFKCSCFFKLWPCVQGAVLLRRFKCCCSIVGALAKHCSKYTLAAIFAGCIAETRCCGCLGSST